MNGDTQTWHDVDAADVPEEGRVRSVTVGGRSVALTRCAGRLGALEGTTAPTGRCPLGEGSIEKGWARSPWHGYDYDPVTGQPHPKASPTGPPRRFPSRIRTDGVYVEVPDGGARARAHRQRRDGRDPRRTGASPTSSGWSATPTSASPTRSGGP